MLTTSGAKRLNLNKLFNNRKAHPKHSFLFSLCLPKLETLACQQQLATDRSLKLILTDSNRGGRKVELKSVHAFFVEMSAFSEVSWSKATKMGWQKYSNMCFLRGKRIFLCASN